MKRGISARRLCAALVALAVLLAGVAAQAAWVSCTMCGGSGRTICGSCYGSGGRSCPICGGSGIRTTQVYDPVTMRFITQITSCTSCGGRGRTFCASCSGTGWRTCLQCGGTGRVEDGRPPERPPEETEPTEGVDDPGVPYETAHGTVLAGTKSNYESENVKCLLDGDRGTKYCTVTTSLYVIWKAPKPIAVSGYVITTGNDNSIYTGRNPKSWTLYGSSKQLSRSSADWKKLHQVTNDTTLRDVDYQDYSFTVSPAAEAYQFFKLEVTGNCGDRCTQMTEFTLKGKEKVETTEAVVKGLCYALDGKTRTATLTGVKNKNATQVVIPASIKVDKVTYRVTGVKAYACKDMKRLSSVTIGKYVTDIGRKAFYACGKLSAIIIKGKKLLTGAIGAHAFKGVFARVVVTCPKGTAEQYRKLLTKKGIGAKATFC